MRTLPSDPAWRGQVDAVVARNEFICREHYRLTLLVRAFPPTEPGQFIQILCHDPSLVEREARLVEWESGIVPDLDGEEFEHPVAILRRPFSLAGRRDVDGATELVIIHRVVGVGTDWMSRLNPGDTVNVLGPLGNRFELPEARGIALLVGGGVGIPPMIYLADALRDRKAVAFCGATTRDLLCLTVNEDARASENQPDSPLYNIDEFARNNIPAVISTDDGTFGFRGYVTQALERYLDAYITDNADRARAIIYTCGPEPMMKRVQEIALKRQIECQIAVERAMACGMGTCQSCCIRVLKPDPASVPLPGSDWCYRLACTDGPVFRGTDLLW
jgi:dihydroorotate dehydrogenase electron transfer subunit